MSDVICFRRKLDSLVLEEVELQAERSWHSSQSMPTEVVDALVVEVKRLRTLIPDAGLLRRLAYATWHHYTSLPVLYVAQRAQIKADAAAARTLAQKIEEANVDET